MTQKKFGIFIFFSFSFAVFGTGVNKTQEVTLLKQVTYKGYNVNAEWPLGSAIELLSS